MARVLCALLLAVTASVAVGQEPEPAAAAAAPAEIVEATEKTFSLHLDAVLVDHQSPIDPEREALRLSEAEYRRIFWDAPMGRLRFNMAAEMSMVGRHGLVHGGHMVGVGLAPTVLGDASPGGLQMLASGGSWHELSTGERWQASFQAAFGAAILWALIDGAD